MDDDLTPTPLLAAGGGRKFILAMTAVILGTFLTWFGKVEGTVWSTAVIAVCVAYITGNVAQKLSAVAAAKRAAAKKETLT